MIGISGTLSKGWLHEALGVAFDRDYYLDPARRRTVDCLCNEYAAREFPALSLFYSEARLGQIGYWDAGQVLIGGIQPNMILGMLLGAELVAFDDRDADITPCCLAGADAAELPAPETLLHHDLIRLFDSQIARVQSGDNSRLRAIPPFFWDGSGRAAIHGVLTSAQKLFGEAIFLDLVTEREKCRKILQWIADAFVLLCRHFAQIAELPITEVHVGECSCCMVSPALVTEFIVPVTSALGRTLGPVRFHSCGPSTHLLEALAGIANLGALDLGGETSIRRAREVFGRRMPISVAPSPQDLSAESTGPVMDWAERILDENDGGNLEYVYHLESGYNLRAIYALTDFVKRQPDPRDPPIRGRPGP